MRRKTSFFSAPRAAAFLTALLFVAAAAAAPAALAQRSKAGRAKPQSAAVSYSCPMHPSVKSKRPGQKCPKCKMKLVRDDEADAEATTAAEASDQPAASSEPATPPSAASTAATSLASIPDVELLNQDGEKVRFYSDLVKGKVVAVNFIFTTCTTICPPLGATFARVQKDLGERAGRDVHFISVSVDPATDTPERLKAWGAKFKAGPGWTFVTGAKPQVDELLRALAASASRREDHTPTVLIGNDATGQWTRAYGLAKPSQLVKLIEDVSATRAQTSPPATQTPATQTPAQTQTQTPTQTAKPGAAATKAPPDPLAGQAAPPAGQKLSTAHGYFSDVELLNQDGEKLRFYSDVLKGKTVVINAFFATCTGVCPPMNRSMKAIQEALGDRVGKDVFLVSITVDPTADTPTRLKEYAKQYQAKPGWVFLTGKKENVDWALYKLGQYVDDKSGHKSVIIIGNEATGLWKKAFGLAKAEELIAIVNGVMNDKGAESK